MAVKIRLARRGRKKAPIYDIVVADSRSPRDGKFIEKIGQYNPNANPASISLKNDRAVYWLMVGAEPTDTTRKILSVQGAMLQKHLQVGVVKGAITQEVADARFEAWLKEKTEKNDAKVAKMNESKDASKKALFEAEKKKRTDMEEARKAAQAAAEAAAAPAEEAEAETEGAASEETEA
jgi:small subunit ribosomal protein S16